MSVLLCCLLLVMAPTTAPAPHPAEIAAAKLAAALDIGDTTTARTLLHADPEHAEFAAAYLEVLSSSVLLRDATTDTFSPRKPDAEGITSAMPAPKVIRTNGETQAWVRMNREDTPLMFRLVGGQWKLDVAAAAGVDPENVLEQTRLFQAMALVMRTLADDIVDGKYATAADARVAVSQKMSDLMSKRRLTTQPATKRSRRAATTQSTASES